MSFSFLAAAPAARAAEEDPLIVKGIKSGGALGAEMAFKAVAGAFYDHDCKGGQTTTMSYICGALGGLSGRAEQEWKQNVTKQLENISNRLETIETQQKAILADLRNHHAATMARFDQAAQQHIAVSTIVAIDALWEKFQTKFDKVDKDVERDAILAFAAEIRNSNLHTRLSELNVVLTTTPVLNGQPLLVYSLHEWRETYRGDPYLGLSFKEDFAKAYDFAESELMVYRTRQQQLYTMYYWAAGVFEADCAILKQSPCAVTMPRSTKDIQADFERYTRSQMQAFNAGVDWLVLSYASPHHYSPRFVMSKTTGVLRNADFLTSAVIGSGQGMWGRVYSMGNAWDGALQVTCGGRTTTVKPALQYATRYRPDKTYVPETGDRLDWWVSSNGSSTYDVVRFSDQWQVNHYHIPAGAGPCAVAERLPQGGLLPWIQSDLKVAELFKVGKEPILFGNFLAVQRAGGTYALKSGEWTGSTKPEVTEDGGGERKKVVLEWEFETDAPEGPRLALLSKGRGEWTITKGSRIHNRHRIWLRSRKAIRFPDDGNVKVHMSPQGGNICKAACLNDAKAALEYDIENNDTELKQGKMDAVAAIYLARDTTPSVAQARGQGIVIDASYGKTGDRKTGKVNGQRSGAAKTDPNASYYLVYLIDFDVETEGRWTNATEWSYGARLVPDRLYFTR